MTYGEGPIVNRLYGLYRGDDLLRYANGAEACVWFVNQTGTSWNDAPAVAEILKAVRAGFCSDHGGPGGTGLALTIIEKRSA